MYTCVGNLLLYKLFWSINVYLWSQFNINYISTLSLHNKRANPLHITNLTSTWLVLFLINMLLYYRVTSSTTDNLFDHPFLRWLCPLSLIICTVCYLIYQRYLASTLKESLGLFTPSMYSDFVFAAALDPTFRNIFAADYLTSFTKVRYIHHMVHYMLYKHRVCLRHGCYWTPPISQPFRICRGDK